MLKDVRAYDPQYRLTRLRGPSSVQIQTINRCNASCLACPYSDSKKTGPPQFMDDEVYQKILLDLHKSDTIRSICLMLQNEPLLDDNLPDRIRQARRIFGDTVLVKILTNGSMATWDNIQELLDCGLDNISVSIDAYREDTYSHIRKGLNFIKVVENTKTLVKRMPGNQLDIRFLKQDGNEGEEKSFAHFWRSLGASVRFDSVTNRAGALNEFDKLIRKRLGLLQTFVSNFVNYLFPICPLPFTRLGVLWDGRVILCPNDWGPKDIVGDLSKQSLEEVWNGEAMNHYRHLLWNRRGSESRICKNCSLLSGFWNF